LVAGLFFPVCSFPRFLRFLRETFYSRCAGRFFRADYADERRKRTCACFVVLSLPATSSLNIGAQILPLMFVSTMPFVIEAMDYFIKPTTACLLLNIEY